MNKKSDRNATNNSNTPNQQLLSQDEIFNAMQKLTKMIEIDRKSSRKASTIGTTPKDLSVDKIRSKHTNSHIKDYYEALDDKNNNYDYNQNDNKDLDSINDADLIENVKAAAKDISDLMNKSDKLNKSAVYIPKPDINSLLGIHNEKYHYSPLRTDRIVNRLYELDGKKKERIAALQYQKYKEELSTLKPKPDISLTSKLIAQHKITKPINKRVNEVLSQKEQKLKQLKEELEEKKKTEEASLTFKPDIKRRFGNPERNRTIKEFQNEVYAWQIKKNEAIQREQYETITKELESLTFKPLISDKSRKIAAQKIQNERLRIEERLYNKKDEMDERKRLLVEKSKPTFKPFITEKSQNIAKKKASFYDHPWQTSSKSPINKSYIDPTSFFDIDDEKFTNNRMNRSKSPNRSFKYDGSLSIKKDVNGSFYAPKMNEIEHSPAIDFLIKKIGH